MLSGMSYRPQPTPTPVMSTAAIHGDGSSGVNGTNAAGRVWFHEGSGSKNIVRVQFLWGAPFTKAGGSGVRVSLRNPAATSNIFSNDGVEDEFVDVSNGDPNFVSGTWYRTNPFSASRTVAFGEELCVAIGFDPAGRQGSDLIPVRTFGGFVSETSNLHDDPQNIVLEFDDGTFGALFTSHIESASQPVVTGQPWLLDSIGDEFALEFSVPRAMTIDGCTSSATSAAASATVNTVDVILYSKISTVLRSTRIDGRHLPKAGVSCVLFSSAYTLTANQLYRLAIKAVSTDGIFDVRVPLWSVDHEDHFSLHNGGKAWRAAARSSGGCWTTYRKLRPHIFPQFATW